MKIDPKTFLTHCGLQESLFTLTRRKLIVKDNREESPKPFSIQNTK